MFKLYQIIKGDKKEVIPINEIYTVQELGTYELSYLSEIDFTNVFNVYIEDIPLDRTYYSISGNSFNTIPNKYFQDFFGFASISIGIFVVKINIQIEKLKLSEIEDIIIFLWKSDNNIFNNFFSKSTVTSKISNDGADYGLTSKFLTFTGYFIEEFDKLYIKFKNQPFTQLRRKKIKIDYSPKMVTSHSVDWLISNLDEVIFEESFHDHPDSILIDNKSGYIEKIETDYSFSDYDVYENKIILGSFQYLIQKLNGLKQEIRGKIDLTEYGNKEFADFRDLKKLPYLKLFEDSNSILKKLLKMFLRYQEIFKNADAIVEKPRPSNIFASNLHYQKAYQIIKEGFEYKFNFSGELNLLNIRKLSKLYEVYNLHQILSYFKSNLKIENFSISTRSNAKDGILEYVLLENKDLNARIEIYYDLMYPNKNIPLIRLDKSNGTYYKPDYVISFTHNQENKILVLDAKYSLYYNVKNIYLPKCINSYILNSGFPNDRYRKVDYLILLYPGEHSEGIVESKDHSPQIRLTASKPGKEHLLHDCLEDIFKAGYSSNLFKALSQVNHPKESTLGTID